MPARSRRDDYEPAPVGWRWWAFLLASEVVAGLVLSVVGTTTYVWALVTFLVVGIVVFMVWATIRVLRGGDI